MTKTKKIFERSEKRIDRARFPVIVDSVGRSHVPMRVGGLRGFDQKGSKPSSLVIICLDVKKKEEKTKVYLELDIGENDDRALYSQAARQVPAQSPLVTLDRAIEGKSRGKIEKNFSAAPFLS